VEERSMSGGGRGQGVGLDADPRAPVWTSQTTKQRTTKGPSLEKRREDDSAEQDNEEEDEEDDEEGGEEGDVVAVRPCVALSLPQPFSIEWQNRGRTQL